MKRAIRETYAWLREQGFMVATPSLPQDPATSERARSLTVMQFKTFATWSDVVTAANRSVVLWYHAPLDIHPVRVHVVRVFKNGKIRISAIGLTFTADSGHLNRFRAMESVNV